MHRQQDVGVVVVDVVVDAPARFTAAVGEPPMGYLRSLRLHHARRLLRDERLTVAAVAARVGYTSDVAFATTFRRVVGLPPAEWRRRHPGPEVWG